jgi:hypothetical protein
VCVPKLFVLGTNTNNTSNKKKKKKKKKKKQQSRYTPWRRFEGEEV